MTETVPRPQAETDHRDAASGYADELGEEAALAQHMPPLLTGRDTDALIKEARRLRRRRWFIGSTLTVLLLGAMVGGYLIFFGPPARSPQAARGRGDAPRAAAAERVSAPTRSPDLIQPTTLATLPNGHLLILDNSRDQILELRPDGKLTVFAGNGRLGFTGDGGPARDAELDFGYFSSAGMSVAPDGSVDFLDDGNCRVRQVTPTGVIRTLATLPRVKVSGGPKPTACPDYGLAVSPAGVVYVATSSKVVRLTRGGLIWVAGSNGDEAHEPAHPTPSTVVFAPESLAFNRAGDLFIGSFSPKAVYRLTPTGRLAVLGASYPTAIAVEPNGTAIIGTHFGVIQQARPGGSRLGLFYDVNPKHVEGINWRTGGFQENGLAVTRTGTVYADNAEGNGYGEATVLVRISPSKRASLAPIRTSLSASLPRLNASGFPAALYPPARGSNGPALRSCPSDAGLERFTPSTTRDAERIARTYLSSQFAADIAVTDRAWWTSDFNDFTNGEDLGKHTVTGEAPASKTAAANELARACGATLVNDSLAVTDRPSGYSSFAGTLYFLDRAGHPLVYYVR